MPITETNICFSPDGPKILIVSPDGKIWEITVDNSGVLSTTDTGETA